MNALNRKKNKSDNTQRATDTEVLRFLCLENGEIVYTSPALEKALSKNESSLIGRKLQDVLDIIFEDFDEYSDSNPDEKYVHNQTDLMNTIGTGCHFINMTLGEKSVKRAFQFDWVTLADKKRYLIGSSDTRENISDEAQNLVKKNKILKIAKTNLNQNTPPSFQLQNKEIFDFIDMSPNLMAIMEHDGTLIRYNPVLVNTLGFNSDDLKGKKLSDLIGSPDKQHFKKALRTLLDQNDAHVESELAADASLSVFETDMKAKQGKDITIRWQLKYKDDVIYALGEDITTLKEQQSYLKIQKSQLSEAQALAKMGHWKWNMDDGDIMWSDEVFKIFEQDPETFEPDLENMTALIHRQDKAKLIQGFQRAIIEKRDYEIDFRLYDKDGNIKFIRCEGRCDIDDEGEVTSLFGILQDVTERMQYIMDLRKAKEAAEQSYEAKSRFLANMSHELRTPLNAIIGFSEMMQRQLLGPIGSERYLDYITGIRESGEHLLDLISDILDMSKIEAGKYELIFEEVSVAKIVRLAVHMMESRAKEDGLDLTCSIEDNDLHIEADRRAIMQILLNLLSNSIKFTQKGSVSVDVKTQKTFLCINVSDTGVGIPANKIGTITKPFEQADCSYAKEHEGSGLGLAITKDLAELHGGRIQIESKLNQGTSVTVKLPLKRAVPKSAIELETEAALTQA